jgi:alpha-glucosidase
MVSNVEWWKRAVIYQVYPRSFLDLNSDGIGDLAGIAAKLDYLVELGVDAIWLSPIFPSPMKDFGYDVSNYVDIDPIFGTLADFDRLLESAHRRGLRVLLDFVPNHTSDQHEWFLESRASKDNPKRDWYIWRDPAPDGGPPNNWLSVFGGGGWTFDPAAGQYYYHSFLSAQPDLNWRNPTLRNAMHDVLRFWLNRGVDGFRVDVIWLLIKDDQFRDNPPNPAYSTGRPPHESLIPIYSADRPEVQEVIKGLRGVIDEYRERLLIGEVYLPIERLVSYYGNDLSGAHLPFNFALLNVSWDASTISKLVDEYEAALPAGGWPNWVIGNHDRPRVATRIGTAQTPVAAMLLLTLRGTPTLYYGDEIGMPQASIPPDKVRDPFERNVPGIGVGRDGARIPMQWNSGLNAGFSSVEPWLPVEHDYKVRNVEVQQNEAGSLLRLYRRLLKIRGEESALSRGTYQLLSASDHVMIYRRECEDKAFVVALNFSAAPRSEQLPPGNDTGVIRVSTTFKREGEHVSKQVMIGGNEGLLVELS